ncbi:CopD family protein [Uliginosibacterium paludis]|uniref:Protoporphyrinogen IX oxidase n=1 Tax=Uliginosibacterium paludis TaxID=1615952 RepID=A0ABV2CRS8_9RHOO
MAYPWLKAIHVFFVISWFAGLFYLPRIYVNLAEVSDTAGAEYERLLGMARRLKRFMMPLMLGTWIFGLAITFTLAGPGMWWSQPWLHAKLLLVLCLTAYDGYCSVLLRQFRERQNRRSHVWFRWFNEVPVLFLLGILILVIVRPF